MTFPFRAEMSGWVFRDRTLERRVARILGSEKELASALAKISGRITFPRPVTLPKPSLTG